MKEAASYEEQLKSGGTCYRSQHYDDTLRLLRQLVADCDKYPGSRQGLMEATRAGIIKRWLANYPWGGWTRSEKERRDVRLQKRLKRQCKQ